MKDQITRTSTFLSYVLRHNPNALEISLEPGGWVDVDTLLDRARAEGRSIDRALLEQVISRGEKERFTLDEERSKIRANYGHSIDVNLDLTPTPPPPHLYHGTAQRTLPPICEEGLRPQSRQHVHLSRTRDEAVRVGRRHGSPVVLIIEAQTLREAGHALYRSTDVVWLTDRVPPQFLRVSDE